MTSWIGDQLRGLTARSTIYTVAQFLQMGISFILIPVYTAHLTPADYGVLSIATAIGAVLNIVFLQSMEGVFTRFHYDFESDRERRECYGSLWLFQLAYTAALSLTLELIGRSGRVPLPVPYSPHLHFVVWTSFLGSTAFLLPRALFLVRGEPWKYARLNLTLFVSSTAAVIYFVAFKGKGAAGGLEGMFYATLAVAVPAMFTVVRNIRLFWRGRYVRDGLAFAVPLIPHLLSLWALNLADRLILQRYVSLDEIGVYTLGYQIGSIPQIIALAIGTAIAPFYYETAKTREDGPSVLATVTTYYLLVLAWVGVSTVVASTDVIALVATRRGYLEADRVVPWVVAGSVARGFYFTFVSALYYTKRVKILPVITIVAAATNIGLNLLLIPRVGYMAAAIITFVTFTLQAAMMHVFAQRAYPIPYEWGRLSVIIAVGLGWAIALTSFTLPNRWIDLALKGLLALIFPLALWALRVIPHTGIRDFMGARSRHNET